MDASDRANNNGNGKHVPDTGSLPSAAVVPQGAPVSSSAAPAVEVPAGSPDVPLIVVEDPPRTKDGKFRPGQSGNPKGRPPGTPNLNNEICRAAKSFKLGDKSYMYLVLAKALQDVEYAKLVIPRLFADATEGKPLIDASDNSQEHHHHTETHVRIGEHLSDASTRDAVAQLTERLAARGAFTGEPRHVRQ